MLAKAYLYNKKEEIEGSIRRRFQRMNPSSNNTGDDDYDIEAQQLLGNDGVSQGKSDGLTFFMAMDMGLCTYIVFAVAGVTFLFHMFSLLRSGSMVAILAGLLGSGIAVVVGATQWKLESLECKYDYEKLPSPFVFCWYCPDQR